MTNYYAVYHDVEIAADFINPIWIRGEVYLFVVKVSALISINYGEILRKGFFVTKDVNELNAGGILILNLKLES